MCLSQRFIKQLKRLSVLRQCDTTAVDNQMMIMFRTVFNLRSQAEWKEPEKQQIADLLRLNDLIIREGYRWRLACAHKVVINTMIMRSAAQFLIDDFPDETQPLKDCAEWADLLTDHLCCNARTIDWYNSYWEDPKNQLKIDYDQLLPSHRRWWLINHATEQEPDMDLDDQYVPQHEDELYYQVNEHDISPVDQNRHQVKYLLEKVSKTKGQ